MSVVRIGRRELLCALAAGLVCLLWSGQASAQQWVSYTPTARQTDANVSMINGAWRSTVHFTFPNRGHRVTWGSLRKAGNVLYVTCTVQKSTARQTPYITYISKSYSLGPLARGTYRLRVVANGQTVRETTFVVSGNPRR